MTSRPRRHDNIAFLLHSRKSLVDQLIVVICNHCARGVIDFSQRSRKFLLDQLIAMRSLNCACRVIDFSPRSRKFLINQLVVICLRRTIDFSLRINHHG